MKEVKSFCRNKKNLIAVFLWFISGILFRLWFSSLVPQPLAGDQVQYDLLARDILQRGFLYTSTFRTYGYSLLLALLYWCFGIGNLLALKIVQAGIDAVSGVLVFFIARKIFDKEKPAWIAYILYLLNPFTSTYVSVCLTEIICIFFVTLTFFIFLHLDKKKILLFFLLGLVLGYLPQVRPSYLLFSIVFLSVAILFIKKLAVGGKIKIVSVVILICIYCLPFYYNFASNLYWYQVSSPFLIDNMFIQNVYLSLYIERLGPLPKQKSLSYPPEVWQIYNEFSADYFNDWRQKMNQKYTHLAIQKIKKDPIKFIRWRIAKMRYIWEKHYLFPYVIESEDIWVNSLVYWGNWGLLFLAFSGYFLWFKKVRKGGDQKNIWFGRLVIFLFLSISLIHAFTPAEERYSLSAYPLIILFGGYGLLELLRIDYD